MLTEFCNSLSDFLQTTTTVSMCILSECDTKCPFDKFVSLLKNVVPTDWDKECGIPEPSNNPSNTLATGL